MPDPLCPYVPRLLLRWPTGVAHESRIGTLVSADISGFTALSERLASRGREGAEQLTVVINDCFTGMIGDCNRHGGDVLKFGGDALLVLFDGDGHVERACRAAVEMRRTIGHPRRTSGGGRVKLAVSIGVHSGEFDLFVVRGDRDELLVTGPGSSAAVDAEAAAAAGQIVLTEPTAALLPATWLGSAADGGVLLKRVFGASKVASPLAPLRTPAEFVAPAQAAQILAGAANEHRQVAVSFVEFAGTDSMPRTELAERLQALATIVTDVCGRYDVHWLSTDVYHDGGKFILTAGVPTSPGDDEDRMLRAIRDVVDADPGLALRAGVHRGYVFAGDLGAPGRRVYTTMGDAVNLAARLMAKARAGEVVASRPIVDWASSEMEYEPLEPFMVKGKSMPILAGRLGRVVGRRTELDRADTELFGRVDDMRRLSARAEDAVRHGHGSVTILTGEPGIGKSRLALEVVRRHPELPLVFVRCQPYDRLTPYSVVEPLLRTVLGIEADTDAARAGTELSEWLDRHQPSVVPFAGLLALVIGADVATTAEVEAVEPEYRATRTLQLVIELLRVAVTSPLLLLIDDIDLAGDQSREMVQALVEACAEFPLMVIATSASGEALHPEPRPLGPLADADAARLLDALIGEQAIGAAVVRQVVTRSAGNPLFLGELVRAVIETPGAPVPDSLESLVASRVDALDPADRQLLRHASVLGMEVDIELLGRVTSDDLVRRPDRWDRLTRFLEWAAPGVVRFRYDTYWRVVYGGLSFAARRAAHARVIDLIEQDITDHPEPPDPQVIGRLAVHAERAGDETRTWRYANAAAEHAAERSLFGTAAQFYESALGARSAAAGDELAEVAESAATTFNMAGSFEAGNRALALALRLRRDASDRARLLRLTGEIAERRGEIAQALSCYRRARVIWSAEEFGASVVEQARLREAEAGLAYRQARYADAWDLASAALTQSEMVDEPGVAARAGLLLNNLAFHMRLRGHDLRGPDVIALYRRAGDRVGEAHHLNNCAVDLYYAGDWAQSAAMYREAAELCVVTGDVVYEATAINNIAEILSDQGHFADAESMFRHAARAWRSVGFVTGVALVEANLGRLATRTGSFAVAEELLSSSVARFERIGALTFVRELQLRLIDNGIRAGGAVDRGRLDEFVHLARTTDWDANLVVYAERLLAAVERGDGHDAIARDAIDRAVGAARRAGLQFDLALALRERGGDGDRDEADEIFAGLGVDATLLQPLR